MIFRDYSTTGDGLVAALQILRIMKTSDTQLSTLARRWTRFPQLVRNVRVREKKPFEELDGLLQLVAQAEAAVRPEGGRVLLRYSGTEPKARLLIEGRDAAVEVWSRKICVRSSMRSGSSAEFGRSASTSVLPNFLSLPSLHHLEGVHPKGDRQ
jgi:phosphoglucosamine mutase